MFSSHIQSQVMKSHQNELASRAAVVGPHRFTSATPTAQPQRPERRHFVWLRVPRRAQA
jgi:hypothetical protein